MSKQNTIPTTVFVPQAPNPRNTDQLDVWLRSLAGFINGCQEIKESPLLSGDDTVGAIYATRIGAYISVNGEVSITGTSSVISGLPVKALHDSFLTVCNTFDGTLTGIIVKAGEKEFSTTELVDKAKYLISGMYLADSALKK